MLTLRVNIIKIEYYLMAPKKKIFILVILAWANLLVWFFVFAQSANQDLEVVFFDVGQGDSILIQKGQQQILIDGGHSKDIVNKISRQIDWFDRNIEVVISTHPDSDHLTGLFEVFNYYEVDLLLETGVSCQSKKCRKWRQTVGQLVKQEEIKQKIARLGQQICFDQDDNCLTVLFPFKSLKNKSLSNMNNGSIVTRLVTNKYNFLFTGDITEQVERELVEKGLYLESDILKISHHGSRRSSSLQFLQAVNPQAAIISVGRNNPYGHPTSQVLQRLKRIKAKVFRTDLYGDIKL